MHPHSITTMYGHSLRVNALAPGITLASATDETFASAHKRSALDASSTPQDIASAVIMLDLASAITGQTIAVDGGQHLVPRARDVAFGD
ncbi:SDR family oxidoreductase [Rhodoferax antarcticus]|uniref:SDR family oxidoreductase n=1 Tax=Rhodoferax antarcticus TaxID=81479 RepID=UPI003B84ADA9